ncbi:hypothetical protein KXS12_26315 [Priestia filamentosa]|uniref:hypothetical protein n=1 Tax=Priestia filamentosa TaxID=1402861 RepID=UPI003F15BB8D
MSSDRKNDRTPFAMSPEVLNALFENYKEDLLSVIRQELRETLENQEERALEREKISGERTKEDEEKMVGVLKVQK